MLLVTLFGAIVPAAAHAQSVLGPGEDAWHVPGGVLRFSLASRFSFAHETWDVDGTRTPLGRPFSGALGPGQLPTLAGLQSNLRTVSGTPTFDLSLGTARTNLRRSTARIPFELSLGLTSRVMLFGVAPFHTGEHEVNWLLDPDGATVGPNPALSTPGAAATNSALLGGLDTAAARLEALAAACVADPAFDPRCDQISLNPANVQTLINDARTLSNALATTYGGRDGVTPASLVPLDGTNAHTGTLGRVSDVRGRFVQFGIESVPETGPFAAGVPMTVTDLRTLLEGEEYAYHTNPLTRRYQQGFGDIDVGISLLVFDGIGDEARWNRFGPISFGLRQAIAAAYRLPTGIYPDVDDPLLIPTGDGQADIELTSLTDIAFSRYVWASVLARYTIQQPDDRIARIPDGSGSLFIPVERRRNAHYEPGDRMELGVTPRVLLNDFASLGVSWHWFRQDAERYEELAPFTDAIPLSWEGTEFSAHAVGIGFTWSSVAQWQRGAARWPIEVQWDRRWTIAGDGGAIRVRSDRIGVRAYVRLWGR